MAKRGLGAVQAAGNGIVADVHRRDGAVGADFGRDSESESTLDSHDPRGFIHTEIAHLRLAQRDVAGARVKRAKRKGRI